MEATVIFPHQLFSPHPAIADGRPIFLVEDTLYFGPDRHWPLTFHAKKLVLHRASMKRFAASLEKAGHTVHYFDCQPGTATDQVLADHLPAETTALHFCDLVDDVLNRRLQRWAKKTSADLHEHPTPAFLSPTDWLQDTLGGPKKPLMGNFYKKQRVRLNILLDSEGEPEGGQWSFDEDNRKKLPRGHQPPPEPHAQPDKFVKDAQKHVAATFPDALGSPEAFPYPTSHAAAAAWLQDFLENRFELFGPYEDAISKEFSIIYHGVLTPMLNSGLLTPHQIVEETLAFAKKNNVPLNSLEGFIRQIIGWREFMRGMYLLHHVSARNRNFWQFTRRLPPSFYDGTTGIEPVDLAIRRTLETGYCHHIERLMVLGNFMLLCRIHPDDVYRWFMELFIDAYDWVMVPNVYSMSQFADGGIFTTKPYLSGSNYLKKMSDFKKGPWCDVWDALFWTFIADYKDVFAKNARLSRMTWMLDKMDSEKFDAHRANADAFFAKLDA